MTGTDSYSITPATNATADGGAINWAEGQPPSSVNNTARQWMADERSSFNDLQWFQYGTGDQGAGNIAVPSVYSSGTAFTITGADVTLVYHAFRRVRAVGVSTGTIYGTITSSSYNSGNTKTTVNVAWDSGGVLSNETLTISLSQSPMTGAPLAGVPVLLTTLTASNSASLVFTGVSAGYSSYEFIFKGLLNATDNTFILVELSSDRGSNWHGGTDYYWMGSYGDTNGAIGGGFLSSNGGTSAWPLAAAGSSNQSNAATLSGRMLLLNMNSTAQPQTGIIDTAYLRTGLDYRIGVSFKGTYDPGTLVACNAVRFISNNGNITSGTIAVYGIP